MSETFPIPNLIPKPPSQFGDFNWDKASDSLFPKAYNLVSKAKHNPVFAEGLQMVMSLKQNDALIMLQQMIIKHQSDYIKTNGEDAMFTKRSLNANRIKLKRYQRTRNALISQYDDRKLENQSIQAEYDETEICIDQMLEIIAPQWLEMDLGTKASYQSVLLQLLDFYLLSDK